MGPSTYETLEEGLEQIHDEEEAFEDILKGAGDEFYDSENYKDDFYSKDYVGKDLYQVYPEEDKKLDGRCVIDLVYYFGRYDQDQESYVPEGSLLYAWNLEYCTVSEMANENLETAKEGFKDILKDNKLIQEYLTSKYIHESDDALANLKTKTTSDFLVPFDVKKKAHRSAVINYWLKNNGHEDMMLDEWSIKDLRMCNQIIASKFLTDLINKDIKGYMNNWIEEAMQEFAEEKARIYNQSKFSSYTAKMQEKKDKLSFNPGSNLQKQEFFSMLGIESDSETAKGSPQWNRAALEQLNKYLDTLIESKGDN